MLQKREEKMSLDTIKKAMLNCIPVPSLVFLGNFCAGRKVQR